MGESELIVSFGSEAELVDFAAAFATRVAAAGCTPLLVGLTGELGSGKTTWTRAMLRGLKYAGRVPSPTYTLLERYACQGVTVIHLDLYRLAGEADLEHLGIRDCLADPSAWVVVEWPERAPSLDRRCDLSVTLTATGPTTRRVAIAAATTAGIEALQQGDQRESS